MTNDWCGTRNIELNARIRMCGGKIFLTPRIRSIYYCRSTLGGLWKQNFMNGVWAVYTRSVSPHALSLRHFVPAIFVVSLSVSVLLAAADSPGVLHVLPLALVAGSYVVASLYFSLRVARERGLRFFFMLPWSSRRSISPMVSDRRGDFSHCYGGGGIAARPRQGACPLHETGCGDGDPVVLCSEIAR